MIRLQRVGRVHEPVFRVVITDSKNGPKSGKFLEIVGSYDTRKDNDIKQLDVDRIKYWMSKGAKLSDTLHNYLVHKKVLSEKKVNKLPLKKPIKKEASAEVKAEAKVTPAEVKAPEVTEAPSVA
ncbi:MAG: 30S ribosomal protein S16 [bacterium]|nr:30S ribosomal protein S16 [bacterium]